MNRGDIQSVFIATLGTEPQVITAGFDLLRRRGENIQKVLVVHTCQPPGEPIAIAVQTVEQEFNQYPPYKHVSLELLPIKDSAGLPITDVNTPQAAEAAFRLLYQHILAAKQNGLRVHLSIAGGRKTLAVYGMLAAQLLFDDEDRLWHLYSAGDFLNERRLHPTRTDDVHLINIPLVLWSCTAPAFLDFTTIQDPFAALERQRQLRLDEVMEKQRAFVLGVLTASEERVVRELVAHGRSDQEIATSLNISPRTVESHLQSAYNKAEAHWEITDINRAGLISLLRLYYQVNIRDTTDDIAIERD